MGFTEQHILATSQDFFIRVKIAVAKAAIAIANEDAKKPGHAQRVQYAQAALANLDSVARSMAFGVASQMGEGAKSEDGDVENIINSIWNSYAGVVINE